MKPFNLAIVSLLCTLCTPKTVTTAEECVEKDLPPTMCTREYRPVCGCNNKTYSNKCEAEAKGIMKYTEGPCEEE